MITLSFVRILFPQHSGKEKLSSKKGVVGKYLKTKEEVWMKPEREAFRRLQSDEQIRVDSTQLTLKMSATSPLLCGGTRVTRTLKE